MKHKSLYSTSEMAFSFIISLALLMTFNGGAYAEVKYGCCSRIEYQTRILKGVSSATEKLTKNVGKIKTGVEEDIPSELKRLVVDLKGVKASVGGISINLNRHTEDLLVHDVRLKELGLLLEKMNNVINGIHGALTGPKDCSDIRAMGHSTSGVYRVYPGSLAGRIQADVYCDLTTPGGNWLVFQRRKDGSVNFERTWIEYKDGFGNPSGEFWLGNELLYLLTSNGKYKLRIDMEDMEGHKRYAEYSTFSVGSSADKYRLTVSGYTGDAGDSFSAVHNGMQFSAKDEDNDIWSASCSKQYRGGWWYRDCHHSNLNGLYLRGPHKSTADGIEWYHFRGHFYSLKMTEMKIAAVN